MPTTRPRVPGWHPDPQDSTVLRHWDGRRWGDERRPRPSWAARAHQPAGGGPPATGDTRRGEAEGDGGPPPAPSARIRRRWYLLAGAALLFAFLLISVPAWLGSGLTIPPRSVSDEAFTTRAETVCAGALPKLRQDRPQSREDTGTSTAFAARIEKAADGLGAVVSDLRAIPVAGAADDARVDRWLDDWDGFIAVGHRFADAIRAEDRDRSDELSARSHTLSKRIFLFAKANDMPSCVF